MLHLTYTATQSGTFVRQEALCAAKRQAAAGDIASAAVGISLFWLSEGRVFEHKTGWVTSVREEELCAGRYRA